MGRMKGLSGAGIWTLDATKFNKMLGDLQNQFSPPLTAIEVLNSEALSILQGAARKTKRTNINKLKARYNIGGSSKYAVSGEVAHIPMVRIDGKLVRTVSRRLARDPALKARVMKRVAYYKKRAMDRIGLSKAIFMAIAKDSLDLPGADKNWGADSKYIEKAYNIQKSAGKGPGAPSSGKGPKHGGASKSWHGSQTGSATQEKEGYVIKFTAETMNTLNPYAKGVAAAQSAINGRVGLFRKGMKKGFFDDLKFVTKNYPNVRVS